MLTETKIKLEYGESVSDKQLGATQDEHIKSGNVLLMIAKAKDYKKGCIKNIELFPNLTDMNRHWKKRVWIYEQIIDRLKKYYNTLISDIQL